MLTYASYFTTHASSTVWSKRGGESAKDFKWLVLGYFKGRERLLVWQSNRILQAT
jgi:hypothetical protein